MSLLLNSAVTAIANEIQSHRLFDRDNCSAADLLPRTALIYERLLLQTAIPGSLFPDLMLVAMPSNQVKRKPGRTDNQNRLS